MIDRYTIKFASPVSQKEPETALHEETDPANTGSAMQESIKQSLVAYRHYAEAVYRAIANESYIGLQADTGAIGNWRKRTGKSSIPQE